MKCHFGIFLAPVQSFGLDAHWDCAAEFHIAIKFVYDFPYKSRCGVIFITKLQCYGSSSEVFFLVVSCFALQIKRDHSCVKGLTRQLFA